VKNTKGVVKELTSTTNSYTIPAAFVDDNLEVKVEVTKVRVVLPVDKPGDFIILPEGGTQYVNKGEDVVFKVIPEPGKTVKVDLVDSEGKPVTAKTEDIFDDEGKWIGTEFTIPSGSVIDNIDVDVNIATVTVTLPDSKEGDFTVDPYGPQVVGVDEELVFSVFPAPGKTVDVELKDSNGTPVFAQEKPIYDDDGNRIGTEFTLPPGTSVDNITVGSVVTQVTVFVTESIPGSFTATPDGATVVNIGDDFSFEVITEPGKTTAVKVTIGSGKATLITGTPTTNGIMYEIKNIQDNVRFDITVETVTVYLPDSVPGKFTLVIITPWERVKEGDMWKVTMPYGESISFGATPPVGSGLLLSVRTSTGDEISGGPTYVLSNVTDNTTVVIDVGKFVIEIPQDEEGRYEAPKEVEVTPNGQLEFTVTPEEGYRVEIEIEGYVVKIPTVPGPQPPSASYPWAELNEDGSVTVFVPNVLSPDLDIEITPKQTKFTVIVANSNGISIDPSGTITYPGFTKVTYTFTEKTGYVLRDVEINGVSLGAVHSYTFQGIEGGTFEITVSYDMDWSVWLMIGGVSLISTIGFIIAWVLFKRRSDKDEEVI